MAIYSLHHRPIGKGTQPRPYTAAAHIRYIARRRACSLLMGERMPSKSGAAQSWMRQQEADDRKNARICDKVLLALPRELDAGQRAALVRSFAERVTKGRASWLAAFHDKGHDRHNPHCHLVIRDRDLVHGKRVVQMSERGSTEYLRALWEQHANAALEAAGCEERIDRRTLKAQGIDRIPTIHEGLSSREMTAKGRRIRSRPVNVRNGPGAHARERVVDYGRFDQGRSRPAYNRHLRETQADHWAALDTDAQRREIEALRAIHRPDLVNVGPLSGIKGSKKTVETPSQVLPLKPPLLTPRRAVGIDVSQATLKPAADRITGRERHDEFADKLGPLPLARGDGRIRAFGLVHAKTVKRPSGIVKGMPMIDDEELRNRKKRERDNAQQTADRDQAHYENLMDRSFLEPKSAEKKMEAYRAKHGDEALRERLSDNSRKTAFGRRPGSILSKDGYSEGAAHRRQDSQISRQTLPDAVARRNASRDRLAAAERAARGEEIGQKAQQVDRRGAEPELFSTRSGPGGDHSYAPVTHSKDRDALRDFERDGRPKPSFSEWLAQDKDAPSPTASQEKTPLLERWKREREKDKERGR